MQYLNDYSLQWLAIMGLTLFLACLFPIRRNVGSLAALTILWLGATSLNVWLNSQSTYNSVTPYDLMSIKQFSLDSLAKFSFLLALFLYASRNRRSFAAYGMITASVFVILDCAIVFLQLLFSSHHCSLENTCGGLVGNPSMNACFLVVLLPLALKTLDPIPRGVACLAVLLAVLISKASIPLGLLAAMACLFAIFAASKRTILIAASFTPLVLALGAHMLGKEFLNSGDRVFMWSFFLSKWNIPANWIAGTGWGTFGVFSINLQHAFHVRENGWWIWLHNDWLQTMFETGLTGALLLVATYLRALYLLAREQLRHEAVALGLYGLMMAGNYPTHLAPTALFGCWIGVLALTANRKTFDLKPPPTHTGVA